VTKLMHEALSAIAQLPAAEQDAIAMLILDELACEERWARLLARSQDELSRLARDALDEYQAGRTARLR